MADAEASRLIEVTDRAGALQAEEWLRRAETLHRELRPQLPAEYVATLRRIFAGGARMLVGVQGERVVGLAVWRVQENTVFGRFLYVDDLVTDPAVRSRGVGAALLSRCESIAVEEGCREFVLDSGLARAQAHRFYFREGLVVRGFHFGKTIAGGVD